MIPTALVSRDLPGGSQQCLGDREVLSQEGFSEVKYHEIPDQVSSART